MKFIDKTYYDDLTSEQIDILDKQIRRFDELSKLKFNYDLEDGQVDLQAGTLIHGLKFKMTSLVNIARTGIVSGEAIGIIEDGETFKCADFHRVPEDITLSEYNRTFPYRDGRCPFGGRGKSSIAFIINPNAYLEELIKYDCYRDNTMESYQTKSFVNMKGLPIENREKAASILFGIPSNFINGIILGDRQISMQNIEFLNKIFPKRYISRSNGEIIYKNGYTHDKIQDNVKRIKLSLEIENKDSIIEDLQYKLENEKKEKERIWKALAALPVDSIVEVLQNMNYQGSYESQVEYALRIKEIYKDECKKSIK